MAGMLDADLPRAVGQRPQAVRVDGDEPSVGGRERGGRRDVRRAAVGIHRLHDQPLPIAG